MNQEEGRKREIDVSEIGRLCRRIRMPREAEEILTEPGGAERCGRGMPVLKEQLAEAAGAEERYRKLGIPEEVYRETMACFSRFVREYREMYGCVGFDREWWTPRQLGLKLFRIGELEYELLEPKAVSVHIPSDARLSEEKVGDSYREAERFLKNYFPEYADKDFVCESWLLSPYLKEVLPENSNIIRFQSAYTIERVSLEDKSFMEWIFHTHSEDLTKLPQNTSLQRNVKQRLEQGKKIGSAFGIRKR